MPPKYATGDRCWFEYRQTIPPSCKDMEREVHDQFSVLDISKGKL